MDTWFTSSPAIILCSCITIHFILCNNLGKYILHKCHTYFCYAKKAIRIISNAKYNDHTSKLILNLSILTLFQLVKSQTCIMMYKAFSIKLPHNIQSYFTKSFSGNEYRTRQKIVSNKNILEQLKDSIAYLILGLKCGMT